MSSTLGSNGLRSHLLVSDRLQTALSFCLGWACAGGSLENEEYLANRVTAERLRPLFEKLVAEVEAVHEAAREWCAQHKIPVDFFSGPLAIRPLAQSTITEISVDKEILEIARSTFAAIKLRW